MEAGSGGTAWDESQRRRTRLVSTDTHIADVVPSEKQELIVGRMPSANMARLDSHVVEPLFRKLVERAWAPAGAGGGE